MFEKIYFKYVLYDITDYKGVFFFFASGKFIVPVLLFLFVWALTKFGFILYNEIRKGKYKRKYEAIISTKDKWFEKQPALKRIFNRLSKSGKISQEELIKLRIEITTKQSIVEEYLILCIRLFILLIWTFVTISYFGWLLFTLSIVCLIVCILILFALNLIMEILPDILVLFYDKLKKETEAEKQEKNPEDIS
jgi:ABC-type multidrug transport system fused ATPase/permease subunit